MPQDTQKSFKLESLSEPKRKDFEFVNKRIGQLREGRKLQFGVNLETIWSQADQDFAPHRLLGADSKRVVVTDEEKGWRGALVKLGSTNWQSDISQVNPFIKIQTALAILVDQNPTGVFTAAKKAFQATTELLRQLYNRSWQVAKSKQQLKLFVFNLAKYGWACARTYPLRVTRKVKVIKSYNAENPEESEYEEKEIVEYNDIFRENLDPWNVWIDDMAKPNNEFSVRDWCWRKVYAMDSAEEEFGKYARWKLVQPGGVVSAVIDQKDATEKKFQEDQLVEILFYENRLKDLFCVIANGVPVIIEPLPISDAKGNKKLSLWQTYWLLRHAECPYGIGIYEAIRYEQALLDRIRNMTIDQLTLSIYKMFFYTGTQSLTETGDIKITPGAGKQVLDPKAINWLEVPGPGAEAWKGLEWFKKDLDEASGITETLMGITSGGETAFEIAQAKESALKRLKNPLENITDALENEAYITISLTQLLYSIPETYAIAEPSLIEAYLNETKGDLELFERGVEEDEFGNQTDTFTAKVFPEFPLNLDSDNEGNLIETEETQFFRIKPRFLKWEGIVNVKAQSILTPSKQVDKALETEMYNLLIPLLAQPPEVYNKIAKNIVKLYDKDPRDILPELWLSDNPQQEQPLIIPQEQAQGGQQSSVGSIPRASGTTPERPQSLVGKIMGKLSKPFRL